MTYRAYREAELGFLFALVELYDKGLSIRDLAAGCGLRPNTIKQILKEYGEGVRVRREQVERKRAKN